MNIEYPNFSLTPFQNYKYRLIQEDPSIISGIHQHEIIKGRKLNELSDSEIKTILNFINVRSYLKENAKILDQKNLLNTGICPDCGNQIKKNEKYWTWTDSEVLLFICDKCYEEGINARLQGITKKHPKYKYYKTLVRDLFIEKRFPSIYKWTMLLFFALIILIIVDFIRAIIGGFPWTRVGKEFIFLIVIFFLNLYLLSYINDDDL
jgi:hypothetical protein